MRRPFLHITIHLLTFLVALIHFPSVAIAETVPNTRFKAFIEDIQTHRSLSIHQYKMVHSFYAQNSFSLRWFSADADSSKRTTLKYLLANSSLYALNPSNFHYTSLSSNRNERNTEDTFKAEVLYTDAALSFMHDLAYGGDEGFVKYNGLKYHPDHLDLISTLNEAFKTGNFLFQITKVEPKGDKFNCLREEYLKLLMLTKSIDFSEVYVKTKDIKTSNTNLVKKLHQLGYLSIIDTTEYGLKTAVYKLQRQHKLPIQNSINADCLKVLNETIAYKLEQLVWNTRWYRWLNGMKDKPYLVVNIPANHLTYYKNGIINFECEMVVGKISTPTPTLTSEIKNVVYCPYWNIPQSIAVNEMFPRLKKDPGYFKRLKIQVLNNGSLRQTPGCHNALGRLKFDFENPFHVYLHDTNAKNAFLSNKRFFSHGCMRDQKVF